MDYRKAYTLGQGLMAAAIVLLLLAGLAGKAADWLLVALAVLAIAVFALALYFLYARFKCPLCGKWLASRAGMKNYCPSCKRMLDEPKE